VAREEWPGKGGRPGRQDGTADVLARRRFGGPGALEGSMARNPGRCAHHEHFLEERADIQLDRATKTTAGRGRDAGPPPRDKT